MPAERQPAPGDFSQRVFTFVPLPSLEAVRAHIRQCEGQHVQQVCYSTFMDALTQICFTEQAIRSNARWAGGQSWVADVQQVADAD